MFSVLYYNYRATNNVRKCVSYILYNVEVNEGIYQFFLVGWLSIFKVIEPILRQ